MDLNRNAFRIVQALTQEGKDNARTVAGRIGGRAGGPARAKKLTPGRRKAIALKANLARWKRKNNAATD